VWHSSLRSPDKATPSIVCRKLRIDGIDCRSHVFTNKLAVMACISSAAGLYQL
jgi:hypothetical protein